ncbi:MAG TPA: heme NO-binding domain-containing protein [Ktedonobacterales bacterium]|nr:heme NO-binding domain-containing protein [Ktedonobacterales bacterium]
MREYGRYFILNGLTSRLCSYLLDQVHGGRDLLLAMSRAHEQMHHADAGVTPPLFEYGAIPGDPFGLYLTYDSPRQLCSLLHGSIEGTAMRYGEQVRVSEETCMKRGAPACTFAIQFLRPSAPPRRLADAATASYPTQTSWPAGAQAVRREAEHLLADAVYAILPAVNGLTLSEVQDRLRENSPDIAEAARPFLVLEALNHLHHVGWVATTANEPGDTLSNRRYWRVAPVGH